MANTLTNLIPTLYQALDIVSRELTGFIPSVARNSSLERAGKDQTIRIPVTQSQSAADITPAQTAPNTGDQTIDNVTITIDKARQVPIRWNGEEQRSYSTNGTYGNTFRDQVAQAMRTLVNEIEADIAAEYVKSSRAYGTSGTTPFASSLEDAAQIKKILDDNGAPMMDRTLVMDTSAGVNFRTLTNMNQANTAGTDVLVRQGVLLDTYGIAVKESAQIQTHTKGTETTFDCTAIEPIGETTIAFDGGAGGTCLAGDAVVIGSTDTNKYIVATGDAAATTGSIVLGKPGVRIATAINDEIVIQNNYVANLAFHRDAIQLITRAPAMPLGGDMAVDSQLITDPRTGITFEITVYKEYKQVHYEVGIAWGVSLIKPEHTAILLG